MATGGWLDSALLSPLPQAASVAEKVAANATECQRAPKSNAVRLKSMLAAGMTMSCLLARVANRVNPGEGRVTRLVGCLAQACCQ